jgi:ABC-type transport system substrate-binding protein
MSRRWPLSVVVAGLLTVGAALPATSAAMLQEDESGAKKPTAKAAKPDTEKPGKPAEPGKPTDSSPMDKPAVEPPSQGPFNLAEEAAKAKHPAVKAFLAEYAKPHDWVAATTNETFKVEPLNKRYDSKRVATLTFTVQGGNAKTLPNDVIKDVRYYELSALQDARKLIGSGLDAKPPGGGNPTVTRLDLLRAAEMALTEVLKYHVQAKGAKNRLGEPWNTTEQDLKQEILNTRIAEIRAYADEGQFEVADALGGLLFGEFPGAGDLLDALEKIYTGRAHAAVREGQYPAARDSLDTLARKYRITKAPEVVALRKQLEDKTRELYHKGVELADKGQKSEALKFFEEGMRITPDFPRLKEKHLEIVKEFAVLRVGVRTLPTQMSPTTALTDADKMATRLIFENLFRLRAAPSAKEGYVCDLGADVHITTKGLDIHLPPDLKWSDGKPISAEDVSRSFEILVDPRSPYYDPVAKELVQLQIADPQRFTLTLRRSYLDPIALGCFPIIPAEKLPKDRHPRNEAFGLNPVGSGPYMFKGKEGDGEMVFTANPHYRRPEAPEGPFIKEIRFIKYDDFSVAKEALVKGRWQIVLDLTTKEIGELAGIGGVAVHTPSGPDTINKPYLNNSRVYFLAVNHRKQALNLDVRKAIAAAIDREKILSTVFRGSGKSYHTPLNGPFPLGSWAYNEDGYAVPPGKDPLFNPGPAKGAAEKAGRPAFTFRYALDDPQAMQACGEITRMLRDAGLQVSPRPTRRADLAREFTKDQPDYDIAYWHYDFDDNEALSLWPLLDPNGVGERGRNYLGFERDNDMQGKLRDLLSHREFTAVKQTSEDIHDLAMRKMIIVPLWQLDRHIAVHRSLQFRRLHPLFVFDDPEQWKLLYVEAK